MSHFSSIGNSPTRVDALEKVTGKAKFTADFSTPGMLYIKVVRSSHAHARILKVDISKAEILSGVRGILKPGDVPPKRTGQLILDRYLLPYDNIVRYVGEPVLAIAADTIEAAEEAADLIRIDYKELPAIFDPEKASSKDTTVILHPGRDEYTYEANPRIPQILDPNISNLQNKAILRVGDTEKGFAESDLIISNRYAFDSIQHCPIETHIYDAWVEADNILTIRASHQGYFLFRNNAAKFFVMPVSKVRILGPYCGGGFGSKLDHLPALLVSLVAMKLGKPVRWQYTRAEELISGGRRPATVVYLKHGVKKDGTLWALEARIVIDGGAYGSSLAAGLPTTSLSCLASLYRIPNVKVDSYTVYTNLPPPTTMRGVEIPETVWGVEQQMDIIAEKLGLSPIEIRQKNILNVGDKNPMGQVVDSIGAQECLAKAAKWIELDKKPECTEVWVKGKGISLESELSARGYSGTAYVKVISDGTLQVGYGAAEIGQGSMTVMAQIAAEEFQVPTDKVKVVNGDTTFTPFGWDNKSSSSTLHCGMATIRAARDAKLQLCQLAAPKLGLAPEDLDVGNSHVFWPRLPTCSIRIQDLFNPHGFVKGVGEIVGRGEYTSAATSRNLETGQYEKFSFWSFGAHAVEVAVNLETGEVRVLRVAGAFDVGQPMNPKLCEQQIDGGIGMGIGTTIYEALQYNDKGKLLNPDLVNYKIPTMAEVPTRENIGRFLVSEPNDEGPYGARGFGEVVLSPLAAAIGNAVYNATGVRFFHAPLFRHRILKSIKRR